MQLDVYFKATCSAFFRMILFRSFNGRLRLLLSSNFLSISLDKVVLPFVVLLLFVVSVLKQQVVAAVSVESRLKV